jgi:hypothetical protein
MRATEVPAVSGLVKVGGVLTVTGGAWTPAPTATSIAWYADGVAIPGATESTLKLGPDQLGKKVTAVLTARRNGYTTTSSSSEPTVPVAPEKLVVTRRPTLTGTARVGQAVVATPGVIAPADVTVDYRWLRDGTWIKGARQQSYTPTVADLGSRLSVVVRYRKDGYTPVKILLEQQAPVRAAAKIRVSSPAHRTVTVTVSADGVANVGGTVTLINAHGVKRTRTLVHGTTTFRPSWIHKGQRTFTIVFSGSRRVDGKTTTRTLAVR